MDGTVLYLTHAASPLYLIPPSKTKQTNQITGRAGRFQSRFEEGVVSARTRSDLALIAHALKSPDPPVEAAGVAPTREQLQLFARANGLRLRETEEDYRLALESRRRVQQQLQQRGGRTHGRVRGSMCGWRLMMVWRDLTMPKHTYLSMFTHAMQMSLAAVAPDGHTYIEFARLLQFFQRAAKLGGGDSDGVGGVDGDGEEENTGGSSLYFLVEMDDMVDIARMIEEVPMSLEDRFTFCLAPVDAAKRELMAMLRFYALQFYRDGCVRGWVRSDARQAYPYRDTTNHSTDTHNITGGCASRSTSSRRRSR
jgi:hypothetical protein